MFVRTVDADVAVATDADLTGRGSFFVAVEFVVNVNDAESGRVVFRFFLLAAAADAELEVIVGSVIGAMTIARPVMKTVSRLSLCK